MLSVKNSWAQWRLPAWWCTLPCVEYFCKNPFFVRNHVTEAPSSRQAPNPVNLFPVNTINCSAELNVAIQLTEWGYLHVIRNCRFKDQCLSGILEMSVVKGEPSSQKEVIKNILLTVDERNFSYTRVHLTRRIFSDKKSFLVAPASFLKFIIRIMKVRRNYQTFSIEIY